MRSLNSQNYSNDGEETSGTKQMLLESGKKAFYEKGFMQANLRQICADCGLTTGAFYFLFPSKDDLLCSILSPVVREGKKLLSCLTEQELSGEISAPESNRTLMKFLLFHRKEIIIIMEKCEGSSQSFHKDEIYAAANEFYTKKFHQALGREPKPEVIKMLVDLRLRVLLGLLKEDYPTDKTLFLNDVMAQFALGGCIRIVDNLKDML